jgi:hypothetical protein
MRSSPSLPQSIDESLFAYFLGGAHHVAFGEPLECETVVVFKLVEEEIKIVGP